MAQLHRRHIGHLPWFCECCRAMTSHELLELSHIKRGLRGSVELPYCTAARCERCGVGLPLDLHDLGVPPDRSPFVNPEERALILYGEDAGVMRRLDAERNFDAGLVSSAERMQLLAWAYHAVNADGALPRDDAESAGRRMARWAICLGGYFVLLSALGALTLSSLAGWWLVGAIGALVGAAIAWPFVCAVRITPRQRRRAAMLGAMRRMRANLVRSLAPLEPKGIELNEVRAQAIKQGWLVGAIETNDVLADIVRKQRDGAHTRIGVARRTTPGAPAPERGVRHD
jgi:hypothetical protein